MQTPDDKLYASSPAQLTKEEQANLESLKARIPKFPMNEVCSLPFREKFVVRSTVRVLYKT